MRASLAPYKVALVLSKLDAGLSHSKISEMTGVSMGTISNLRQEHRPDMLRSWGGCPPKLSPTNVRYAVHQVTSDPPASPSKVAHELSEITGTSLSACTVRRYLHDAGLKAVVKPKKPRLLSKNVKARLEFAQRHKHWTVADWRRVVWSDETKVNRLGSDGRKWVWKKAGEGLSTRVVDETLKFGGGSVMLWGCMLWDGTGEMCKVDGPINTDLYISILEDELRSSLEKSGKDVEDVVFQQDNASCHKSERTMAWFQDNGFEVLEWPAQSPDLNPIEHLWACLKRQLGAYPTPPEGIVELWDRIQDEWVKIGPEVCQDLIESMPRRIAAVLKARGGHTKY